MMKQYCDREVPKSRVEKKPKPWILTATILASSMAFIDSTVVDLALPAISAPALLPGHGALLRAPWYCWGQA
jgi:hypothetical protein